MKLKEADRLLLRAGYIKDVGRQKHIMYRKGESIVLLPNHPSKEVKTWLLTRLRKIEQCLG